MGRREPLEQLSSSRCHGQAQSALIHGVTGFFDQPFLQKLVGNDGRESAAEMQVIGNILDADVSFRRKVSDRDQHRVFDAHQTDHCSMAFSNCRMAGQKAKEIMNEAAELLIRAVDQQFRPRNRQGRLPRRLQRRRLYF